MSAYYDELDIFLDESGASGRNFLTKNPTPYFIMAGFVLQHSSLGMIRKIILEWEKPLLKANQKELKGNDFFKKASSIPNFLKLMKEIRKFFFCPTYSIVEKKYAMAIYMVECFLDPNANKFVTKQEFLGPECQREFADLLYENLSENEFEAFNKAILSELKVDYETALFLIVRRMYEQGQSDLGHKIANANVDDGFEFLHLGQKNKRGVNMFAFRPFIFSVKEELYNRPKVKCNIHHDIQLHYQQAFEDFMKLVNTGKERVVPINLAGQFVLYGGDNVKDINFIASHDDPLIRLADLICSFYQKSLTDIEEGYVPSEEYDDLMISFWTQIYRVMYPEDLPKWFSERFASSTHGKIVVILQDIQKRAKAK